MTLIPYSNCMISQMNEMISILDLVKNDTDTDKEGNELIDLKQ